MQSTRTAGPNPFAPRPRLPRPSGGTRARPPRRPLGRWALSLAVAWIGACTIPPGPRSRLPSAYQIERPPLVIHSDFPVASQHRLLEELSLRRTDLGRRLGIPDSNEPIFVYLFEDANRFEAYVRKYHPEFPERRAFFLETDTRLVVYAQWGDRVGEDLRHEVTHAYLHAVVPHLPLWLDEGLAEYFEVPRGHRGLNPTHLRLLLERLEQRTWTPSLARLDQLPAESDLSLDDYAESWAWTHFFLESHPDRQAVLQQYLRELREYGWAEPLSVRLRQRLAAPERALVDHVLHLASSVASKKAPAELAR